MKGIKAQPFSLKLRQQTKARRPPGFSAPRKCAKAAIGSAKNITPKRENSRSCSRLERMRRSIGHDEARIGDCRRIWRAHWPDRPVTAKHRRPARRRLAPPARASFKLVGPVPQPISITRSPGLGAWPPASAASPNWLRPCSSRSSRAQPLLAADAVPVVRSGRRSIECALTCGSCGGRRDRSPRLDRPRSRCRRDWNTRSRRSCAGCGA